MRLADRGEDASAPAMRNAGAWAGVVRAVLFVIGCGLLAEALLHIGDLGPWTQRWGIVPVGAAFVVVLALGVSSSALVPPPSWVG
ncbi:hypothetical protein ACLQ3C_09210 [Gordonia sp. DT30]|uniref:hypothetical protein n=1 Tax=unclassified Gordonia (in: high G+C Gram-positive bacteria) TaxID=2657482 RepID=UPI003CF02D04